MMAKKNSIVKFAQRRPLITVTLAAGAWFFVISPALFLYSVNKQMKDIDVITVNPDGTMDMQGMKASGWY